MVCAVEDRDTIRLRGFCAYRTTFPSLFVLAEMFFIHVTSQTGARSVSEYFHLLFAVIPTLLGLVLCTLWFVPVICSIAHGCITLSHWHTMPRVHSHPSIFSISREVMGKAVACGCWFFISISQFLSS